MIDDKRPRSDTGGFLLKIDDLLAHARFSAVLDAVAEIRATGPLPEALETPLLLARCRALLGLGRWKEVGEIAEKKLSELYALHPDYKRALLEFNIPSGHVATRIGRPCPTYDYFRAAYDI